MATRSEILSQLLNPGIIPVIRADSPEQIMPACQALVEGGITALEITLTVPSALACIREASERFAQRALTGAGSVTTPEACRAVIEAGANFVVTPIMRPEIARVAAAAGRVVILGAFTPTEAQSAFEAGADLVKIFPAIGPDFIRALRGPLPHLKIIPTGGVTLENAPEFLAAGCVALGIGSNLISPRILRERNWAELTRLAAQYVQIMRQFRAARKLDA